MTITAELAAGRPQPAGGRLKSIILRKTDSAVHLVRGRGARTHRAIGAELGGGDLEACVSSAAIKRLGNAHRRTVRRRRFAGEGGQRLLHCLELGKRSSELLPFVHVANRHRKRSIEPAGNLSNANKGAELEHILIPRASRCLGKMQDITRLASRIAAGDANRALGREDHRSTRSTRDGHRNEPSALARHSTLNGAGEAFVDNLPVRT